jgi:type IV pilus assembly protein PilV
MQGVNLNIITNNRSQRMRCDRIPHVQAGVGMVEVLITLFILSIGLLGVASLQFVSALSNSDALNRTQAVLVAQQFSERLRANAVPSTQGDGFVVDNAYFVASAYNFADLTCVSGSNPFECFCQTHPADVPNCQTSECDAQEFAEFDAYEMSCAAVQSNPNATLSLTCTDNDNTDTDVCSAGSIHNVLIKWPTKSLQNNTAILNSDCNASESESNDCIVVEVAL